MLGRAIVNAAGLWTIDPTSNYLVEGANALIVKATNSAGIQGPGAIVNVVLDTVSPVLGVITETDDVLNVVGTIANNSVTNDTKPAISGNVSAVEVGSLITVVIGVGANAQTLTTTVAADGS